MDAFPRPDEVAICYHPAVSGAQELADALGRLAAAAGRHSWVDTLPEPDDDETPFLSRLPDADLLICVGGDGTVLHAAEFAAAVNVPIFGVRMGRLGFLTEVSSEGAAVGLDTVLKGHAQVEARHTVQAQIDGGEPVYALNDVVIGRATLGRTISVTARIDGVLLAEYRADAVLIATATGSTGYSLSVGGPILPPTSDDLILVPVAPHLTRANALVLRPDAALRLTVERGYEAVVTVDGFHERRIGSGAVVEVGRSDRAVRFVRLGGQNQFYANIAERLQWLRLDHVLEDPEA
jgi:NAD+ kinase